jgi:hypothetical protein
MAMRQKIEAIKTRGLKKADLEVDFFLIGNFLSVFSGRGSDITGPAERLSRFFLFFLNAAPELREGKQINTLARHCENSRRIGFHRLI